MPIETTPSHYRAAIDTAADEANWEDTTSVYVPTQDAECWLLACGWRWVSDLDRWEKQLLGERYVAPGVAAACQLEMLAQAA